jgi:uncharacterized protein (DUF302 family)
MTKDLGFDIELPSGFSEAIDQVKDAVKQEGFGILTEIDLQAAFREKLGREFRPYIILGACNPPLAFSAINADPAVGLLLPCNVTIESIGEHRTMVRLTNPAGAAGYRISASVVRTGERRSRRQRANGASHGLLEAGTSQVIRRRRAVADVGGGTS